MHRIRLWLGAALLLLTIPSSAAAQQERAQPSRGVQGAVEKLFEHREQLGLSTDQLVQLQQIRDRAEEQNRPLRGRIMEIWREIKAQQTADPGMTEAEKKALVDRRQPEFRSLGEQIRRNEHTAASAVGGVLTSEQKTMVCQMVGCGGRGGRDRPDAQRGRGNNRN